MKINDTIYEKDAGENLVMNSKKFRHEIDKLDIREYNGLPYEDARKIEKRLIAEQLIEFVQSPFYQEGYGQYQKRCHELDEQLRDILLNIPDLPMAQAVYFAPHIKEVLTKMKEAIGTERLSLLFEIEERLYEHYNDAVMRVMEGTKFDVLPYEYKSIEDTIDYLILSYDNVIKFSKSNNREELLKIFASQILPNFDLLSRI